MRSVVSLKTYTQKLNVKKLTEINKDVFHNKNLN